VSDGADTLGLRWDGQQRWIGTDSWGNEVRVDGHRDGATGAKPSDLLPLSLAACVAYTLVDVFRKRRESIEDLSATIEVEQDPEPPWTFRRIDTHFTVRGTVTQAIADRWLALASQKYCSVSASLEATVRMTFTIRAEQP
jgi:putative redox protein